MITHTFNEDQYRFVIISRDIPKILLGRGYVSDKFLEKM
jgi:hypothetical protein